MNITCKAFLSKPWTLTDDKITLGDKEIPLSDITCVTHSKCNSKSTNGVINITIPGKALSIGLVYPYKQKNDGETAAEYIINNTPNATKPSTVEEFFRKCNVCGNCFSYTSDDLKNNKHHRTQATLTSLAGVSGAFSGHYAASASNTQSANQHLAQIVDYDKCPNCHSSDISVISKEEFKEHCQKANIQETSISQADELKKFKDLLDNGVITQEEFDQKKKQLLGL